MGRMSQIVVTPVNGGKPPCNNLSYNILVGDFVLGQPLDIVKPGNPCLQIFADFRCRHGGQGLCLGVLDRYVGIPVQSAE